MKTELSFLLSLLLDHKLPKQTQKAVSDRMREVESNMSVSPSSFTPPMIAPRQSTFTVTPRPAEPNVLSDQPESTRKLLEKYPDLAPKGVVQAVPMQPKGAPEPEVHGINTPAVSGALAARQQMINEGIAGPKKGSYASPKAHGTPKG